MPARRKILLVTACLVLPALGPAGAQETGLSVGGVSVGVDTNDGLGVGTSVGGAGGVNADATVGGSGGVADVNASVGGGSGVNANVNADVSDGVDVGATASVGGSGGVNSGAGVGIGGGSGVGLDANVGIGGAVPGPGGPGAGGANPGLTAAQQQAFDAMSDTERARLLNRCSDLVAGGTDAELAALCRMLRMTAQR